VVSSPAHGSEPGAGVVCTQTTYFLFFPLDHTFISFFSSLFKKKLNMNAKINSLVADSVRQGCRQLDGYLQDLIVSTKKELRDSVASMAQEGLAAATQSTTDDLTAKITQCLDEFTARANRISLQILDDFETQARCLGKSDIEPLINARIEAVVLKELQKAQQILIEEREETVRMHNNIRKAMQLGRSKSFNASWYSATSSASSVPWTASDSSTDAVQDTVPWTSFGHTASLSSRT